jgi:dihydrofolate reductase
LTKCSMIYGRAAYLSMVAYWPSATGRFARKMREIPKIILSNTLKKVEWNNATLIKDNAAEEIARLKQQPGKDLVVFAGARVICSLTKMGLIDEYHLLVNPILLGRGKPLFKESKPALMTLLDTRKFPCGDVLLKYSRGTLKTQ